MGGRELVPLGYYAYSVFFSEKMLGIHTIRFSLTGVTATNFKL